MKAVNKPILAAGLAVLGSMACSHAQADTALAVRAGSFGYGVDFDVGLIEKKLNLRLGYNTLSYSRTVEDTDVTYDGTLKIGAASALFDWHMFSGGFRLTVGAMQQGPKVDVTGTPSNSSYTLNGTTYQSSEIGSLSGTIKMGDSTAPYIGIGWGNATNKKHRVAFLADIGVIHTGSPKATLNARCGAAVPTLTCDQIKSDAEAERARLERENSNYKWYPVVSLGLGVRF